MDISEGPPRGAAPHCRVCGSPAESSLLHRRRDGRFLIRTSLCEACTTRLMEAAALAYPGQSVRVDAARQMAKMLSEFA